MSQENGDQVSSDQTQVEGFGINMASMMHRHWRMFFIEGIVFVLIGVLAIMLPGPFSIGIELVIGWLITLVGIVMGLRAITSHTGPEIAYSAITALFALFIGVWMLVFPHQGVLTITVLLIFFFLIGGLFEMALAFMVRPFPSWKWIFVSGLTGVLVGAILLSSWPQAAAWAIGLLFGINMMMTGMSMAMMAFSLKESAAKAKS
ncbi:MAG: hypothetical protein HOO00_03455 [Rhodospirillaceae bacterium]|nr:hypothetical protein [Rhodospirillaceae bacterium]MBT5374122.1 hypothetical protein [Rhodospirillaceae bacterium]MBT5659064.1 hypothetical protein [Rhodospirillaceae bacterium]MBT5752071.1 hypothetical protein [Rhodospirillaceae bacterium]